MLVPSENEPRKRIMACPTDLIPRIRGPRLPGSAAAPASGGETYAPHMASGPLLRHSAWPRLLAAGHPRFSAAVLSFYDPRDHHPSSPDCRVPQVHRAHSCSSVRASRTPRKSLKSDDFAEVPFSQMGGLGRAYELFGDRLGTILEELNERLAA